MLLAPLSLCVCLLTAWSLGRDPRWLGNVALLVASIVTVGGALAVLRVPNPLALAVILLLAVSPLLLLVLIVFLLWNGIDVLHREGRSPAHALPLVAAIGVMGVLALCLASARSGVAWFFDVALAVGLFVSWSAALFLGYVVYAWLYGWIARRRRPDYVITLGSGLFGDRVPPLLARRIDRALEVYRAGVVAGRPPLLIMSGGQGSDEDVAEAKAMADYALAQGVPSEDLRVEAGSTSTEENLRFSAELVRTDPRIGPGARGVAVTSNYHALRAAVTARTLGLPIDAVGAPVAWYYWPSAMLREFIAIARMRAGFVLGSALLVSLPLPLLLAYLQYA